eukprot:PhF_6_TR43121/c0_g1_i6/m.65939/K01669/phrB; deoxyribodipyrimidine photo-lyase
MEILWLRSNLRVHDNPALVGALRSQRPILALYVWDPRIHRHGKNTGLPWMGHHRRRFLLESLQDLPFPVHQAWGNTEEVMAAIGKDFGNIPLHVHYQRDHATYEVSVEKKVRSVVHATGGTCIGHEGISMIDPEDLPFLVPNLPELFSDFRRTVEKSFTVKVPLKAPHPNTWTKKTNVVFVDSMLGKPHSEVYFTPPPHSPSHHEENSNFVGGESKGLARLNHYLWTTDKIRSYKNTRNGMLNFDDSSKLSPWLACGCLSPRMIYAEIKRYEQERCQNESTYWLVFELLWRDYFQFWMQKHGSRVFFREGVQRFNLPWSADKDLFHAWCTGNTGYPIVDANMRELVSTGFMSNRGRQIVASFLTKNLGLDWLLGAEFFEHHLIDCDVASNYGNWQYQAGVGCDARGFRLFHYRKQAMNYDPDGAHVRFWVPELREMPGFRAHEPWNLAAEFRGGYPDRIVPFDESARQQQYAYQKVTGWCPQEVERENGNDKSSMRNSTTTRNRLQLHNRRGY